MVAEAFLVDKLDLENPLKYLVEEVAVVHISFAEHKDVACIRQDT